MYQIKNIKKKIFNLIKQRSNISKEDSVVTTELSPSDQEIYFQEIQFP